MGKVEDGTAPSRALDSKEYPHISFFDMATQDLRYASWDGTRWNTETLKTYWNVGRHSSLAIDNQNRPHIGCYVPTQQNLQYATQDTASGSWAIQTIPEKWSFSGEDVKIAFDSAGHVGFVYYDRHIQLKFAQCAMAYFKQTYLTQPHLRAPPVPAQGRRLPGEMIIANFFF